MESLGYTRDCARTKSATMNSDCFFGDLNLGIKSFAKGIRRMVLFFLERMSDVLNPGKQSGHELIPRSLPRGYIASVY